MILEVLYYLNLESLLADNKLEKKNFLLFVFSFVKRTLYQPKIDVMKTNHNCFMLRVYLEDSCAHDIIGFACFGKEFHSKTARIIIIGRSNLLCRCIIFGQRDYICGSVQQIKTKWIGLFMIDVNKYGDVISSYSFGY